MFGKQAWDSVCSVEPQTPGRLEDELLRENLRLIMVDSGGVANT